MTDINTLINKFSNHNHQPPNCQWCKSNPDINEIVAEQIAETENWISTSWSMYLSTGRENFLEDTKRYKRQLSILLAIQDVLAIHHEHDCDDCQATGGCNECGNDYPCLTRRAITNRIGGME